MTVNRKVMPYKKKCELFVNECRKGSIENVRAMLKDPEVDPAYDNNYAVQTAAHCGNELVVEELLKDSRVNPGDQDNFAIRWAAESKSSIKSIKLLLKDNRVDPNANNGDAFVAACKYANYEIVKLLLEDGRVSLKAGNGDAIYYIIRNISILLPLFKNNKEFKEGLYKRYYNQYKNVTYDHVPVNMRCALKSVFKVETNEELKMLLIII